jgi:hypothetical protein
MQDLKEKHLLQEFEKADQEDIRRGALPVDRVSSRSFVASGLKLEKLQYVFHTSILRYFNDKQNRRSLASFAKNPRSDQLAVQRMRTDLCQQIVAWQAYQVLFMPEDVEEPVLTEEEDERVEDAILRLPSVGVASQELIALEATLRKAQIDDSLLNLRRLLRQRQQIYIYKRQQIDGTGNVPQTRALAAVASLQKRIELLADTYRAARRALRSLTPNDQDVLNLQELTAADIRGPQPDRTSESRESEGYFRPTWIWVVKGDNRSGEDNNALRYEWVRMRARRDRWREEVALLLEEMRRSVAYLRWKAHQWVERSNQQNITDITLQSGLRAYALRQGNIFRSLAETYLSEWNNVTDRLSLARIHVPN